MLKGGLGLKMDKTYGYLLLNENNISTDLRLRKWVNEINLKTRFSIDNYLRNVEKIYGRKLSDEEFDEVRHTGEMIASQHKNPLNINNATNYIIVTGEILSISNIVQYSLSLSSIVSNSIIYLSGFDKSVLMIGIARNGQIITQYHIGDGLSSYGIQSVSGNLGEIKKTITKIDVDLLEKILLEQDIFRAEEYIEKIIF